MYPFVILVKGGWEILVINLLKAQVLFTQLKASIILTDMIPINNEPELFGIVDLGDELT